MLSLLHAISVCCYFMLLSNRSAHQEQGERKTNDKNILHMK